MPALREPEHAFALSVRTALPSLFFVRHVLITAIVLPLAVLTRISAVTNEIFTSDPADYVRASQTSLWRLYTDRDSTPPWKLIELRSNPDFRQSPWDFLQRRGDHAALRHFHVPGSFYILSAVRGLSLSEAQRRAVYGCIGAAACGLLACILSILGVWPPLCVAIGVLLAVDRRLVNGDVPLSPNPHTPYFFLLVVLFALVALRLVTRRQWLEIPAAAAAAACTITFELAPAALLAIAVSAAAGLTRAAAKRAMLRGLKLLGVYLACLALFWPGGIFRGGLATCYGVMLGNVVLKRSAYYGREPTIVAVTQRLFDERALYAILFLLFVLAAVVAFRALAGSRLPAKGLLILFATYAACALAFGAASRFVYDTYVAHFLIPLLLTGGFAVHVASLHLGKWIAAVACVILLATAGFELSHMPSKQAHSDALAEAVQGLQAIHLPDPPLILINDPKDAATIGLYLPRYDVEPTKARSTLEARRDGLAKPDFALFHPHILDPESRAEMKERFDLIQTFGQGESVRVLAQRRR